MDIKNVTCVGAGLIGQSWGSLFSLKDLNIYLYDLSEEILRSATRRIESNLRFFERKAIIQKGEVEEYLGRIKTTTSLSEAVSQSDYVQESVLEDYSVKKKVCSSDLISIPP